MPAPDPKDVVPLTQHCGFSSAIPPADEHGKIERLTSIELVPGQAPVWKLPPEQPSAVLRQRPEPAEVEHVFFTQHCTFVASLGQ